MKIELKFSITVLQQVISRGSKVYHLFTTLLLPDYLCNWIASSPSSSWSTSSSSSLSSSLSLLPNFFFGTFHSYRMGAHPVTKAVDFTGQSQNCLRPDKISRWFRGLSVMRRCCYNSDGPSTTLVQTTSSTLAQSHQNHDGDCGKYYTSLRNGSVEPTPCHLGGVLVPA